jgi:hypothetical protein
VADVLVYLAAGVLALWGVSHLVPTRTVVASFGDIGVDNRRILTMEWVAEGVVYVFLAALVSVAISVDGAGSRAVDGALYVCAGLLVAIAGLTLATGARTPVVWFKVCPAVLTTAAALLAAAAAL